MLLRISRTTWPDHNLSSAMITLLASGQLTVQPWASECPDVKNYKWRLNPVWHRMYT